MTELSPTEAVNERTLGLDRMPLMEILHVINDEDAKVALAVRKCLPQIEELVELFKETINTDGHVFFIGAGTSGRLGRMEAAECPPTFGVPRDIVQGIMAGGEEAEHSALEGVEDDEQAGATDIQASGVKAGDLVIGLSASGKTPYVLAALASARMLRARTAAIICNTTDLESKVDVLVTAVVGPEVVSGSTRMKAGTAQKMILNMVTTASMVGLGRVYGNLMVDMRPSNKKLWRRAERIVTQATGADQQTAAYALSQSDGVSKVAILCILCGVSPNEACRRLDNAGGRIHEALAQGHALVDAEPSDNSDGRDWP
jgi:N-acetylmuramic acid 6-phosphate etherase